MRRFFVDKTVSAGDTLFLGADESRHVLSVLRMKKGDRLILINGSGGEITAELIGEENGLAQVQAVCEAPCAAEPECRITLFQGMPKAGKLELIIQKCVELGVYAIQPIYLKRCVVKPNGGDNKQLRFNRVALEAAKQCGRASAPAVFAPAALAKCDFSGFDIVLAAYEDEERMSLKAALAEFKKKLPDKPSIAIVIGPEGGFEADEIQLILSKNENARSVSLGKRILRTETAGMALLAMLMYDLEG